VELNRMSAGEATLPEVPVSELAVSQIGIVEVFMVKNRGVEELISSSIYPGTPDPLT
jgi:hypothetical protein